MAIRSHEELSLATVFARTLRACSPSHDGGPREWPGRAHVLDATPRDALIPVSLFRILQFDVLPEILGESAGPALYLAAKRFSRRLDLRSIQALKDWFARDGAGRARGRARRGTRAREALALSELPAAAGRRDALSATWSAGIIDGVLEAITGTEVLTKETLCWGLGDTVCQFEGYTGPQVGYLYSENGFHPDAQRRLLAQLADQARASRSRTCA